MRWSIRATPRPSRNSPATVTTEYWMVSQIECQK